MHIGLRSLPYFVATAAKRRSGRAADHSFAKQSKDCRGRGDGRALRGAPHARTHARTHERTHARTHIAIRTHTVQVVGEGSLNADGTRRRRLAWESELRCDCIHFVGLCRPVPSSARAVVSLCLPALSGGTSLLRSWGRRGPSMGGCGQLSLNCAMCCQQVHRCHSVYVRLCGRAENSRFGPPLCWQQHSPIGRPY